MNEHLGEGAYPKPAKAYLDDWAATDAGWLRKFYPPGSDEPHYDATPAVEKAVAWVRALRDRSFVGTESRLNTVVELLRQLVFGSETDARARLEELERRRWKIDEEIAAVAAGDFSVLDGTSARDRYQQLAETARALLSDFREVEANFRRLDRDLRERIATWNGAKGDLLDEVVGGRSHIADSDQGRSFRAFYDLLLSPAKQQELTELLQRVHELELAEHRRPSVALHPSRLARRSRAGSKHSAATVRAVAPVPRRSGLVGEPPRHGAVAQHRVDRAEAA